MSFLISALLSLAAGVSIVVQQALNANLRTALNSAAWSGFVSYFVGLLCMIALIAAFRDPVPTAAMAARIPFWAWSGGLFGAIFIALGILLVPKIGAATFIALLVAGQMPPRLRSTISACSDSRRDLSTFRASSASPF